MFDPSNMEQMMKQLGMDMEEINVERVTVETSDGRELVFETPQLRGRNCSSCRATTRNRRLASMQTTWSS
ncbi:MAG: NAC domain-containing protein [Candidatus Nanohaloarchaea archaeon]